MRSFILILAAIGVIGTAFWAYRENYATQSALNEAEKLHRDIGQARARLSMLEAEWAFLNRPDRLRDLAQMNFERLGLLPFESVQFGRIDQVAYPPAQVITLSAPVEVSSAQAAVATQVSP